MSGHSRLWIAVLLTGFAASPAASNPLTDLFSVNATPEQPAAPAPDHEECLAQPGRSTAAGQHWVYRYDGHRKCWFQAAGAIAAVKKPVHRYAAKRPAAAEDDTAVREGKAVVNAELPASAPETTPQSPPAPEANVVDAAVVPATAAAVLLPPAPILPKPATDQLTPVMTAPRHVDVEKLLADAPAASETVGRGASGTPVAVPIAEQSGDGGGWTATCFGVLLIALGSVAVLSSAIPQRVISRDA